MIGHDDPRHGTNAGYIAGCRTVCCRTAHMRYRKWIRLHPRPLVDATGTQRRIEALGAIGWSRHSLSHRLGRHRDYLGKIMLSAHVAQATADVVANLYDELSDTCPLTPLARRTQTDALARGAAAPHEWIDIDDPAEDPHAPDPVLVDDVVVARVLAGEVLPCTPAERRTVLERAARAGRSLAGICRQMGWKEGRYYQAGDAA